MGVPSGKGSVGGGLRIGLDSSTWMKPLCSQLAAGLLGALWLGLGLACGARSPAVAKPKSAASAAPSASGPRAPTLDLKARRARAEQEARLETAQLRSGLNPLAQLALDRLETSAEVTRRKDEERVARERGATAAPDTIVGPYELYLLERHQLRLRHWIPRSRGRPHDPRRARPGRAAARGTAQGLALHPHEPTRLAGIPRRLARLRACVARARNAPHAIRNRRSHRPHSRAQ